MRQIMTVFKFTLRDGLRKKSFIISTIILLILILVACLLPRAFALFSDNEQDKAGGQTQTKIEATCYYIDEDNLIQSGAKALESAFSGTKVVVGNRADIDKYRDQVKENGDEYIVLVEEKAQLPNIAVISQDFLAGVDPQETVNVLSQTYGGAQLEDKGYSKEDIAVAQVKLPFTTESVSDRNMSLYVISLLLTFLIFFAIYYYGYGVAMSIATEKTSRVMETLVISAKPSRILVGKCLGMGILGLIQFVSILAFGYICYNLLVPAGTTIMGMELDVSGIDAKAVLLLVVYFVLGYALYAVMNSVCGALVSKVEDLNSAMMPVMLIALASFYLGYGGAAMGGGNTVSTIAMYIPFSAPFIMPTALLNGTAEPLQILLSIGIMIVATIIITLISIKIYSASVLHYGEKQKLWKLFKQGENR